MTQFKTITVLLLTAGLMLLVGCSKTQDNEATANVIDQSLTPPKFEVLSKHPKYDCINVEMGMFIENFGVYVIAADAAPRDYVIDTANILAQYIDNDEDGIPDDADVLKHLVENNYVVPVWTTSDRSDFLGKSPRNIL